MSRSRKKTRFRPYTGQESEKQEKRDANRKLRRIVKQKLRKDHPVLPKLREISNIWAFGKDGKYYDAEMTTRDLRK